ncbi:NADH-quinone oxidoreductase subunit J [Synechococcus sp. PCC 6312]|uniref:NADH-quinone oxidoreductase subunit J n=1 Tax=Synechococcus sp. (strain ATCC 27167 / PCC 6312) TaxID=195253 RepID=UPI00029EC5B5|nr:NADH-quinone oxidoreductase subunit J [Synechococcus sp. PCC 6312]AFY61636.1 NADH:ubiquinone oxidoreductase subunit 6 (chain J) [Synechococcus sp. PCC 6312]
MDLATGVQTIAYFLLAVLVIGAALGVVLLDSIVYSAFLLGGVFISISGIYILLNADFVSAAQILIYVGAVNVLILFAIMLVNKREDFAPIPRRWIRKGAAGLVASGLFCLLSVMVLQTSWKVPANTMPTPETIVTIGKHFFTDFLLPFELASVLLLMALVGAVVLARRDYLIDEEPSIGEVPQPPLELPERPRESAVLSGK